MLSKYLYVFVALLLAGCGDVSGKIKTVFDRGLDNDFARSQILAGSPTAADGHSELMIIIQLTNSDGTPVKFFKPTYEVVSGSGITSSACTISDANGISTCIAKATVPGSKRISVSNIKISLESNLIFIAPHSVSVYEISAGSRDQQKSGFSLKATVGSQAPLVNRSNGFSLYGGLEGVKASE
ncbi:MAG: hypothetical protein EOP06_00235 [Proteobacteria bacterium]|nr:MAG: hypothetical protein EOP06_00235 [Pseudomonadota bacterium]